HRHRRKLDRVAHLRGGRRCRELELGVEAGRAHGTARRRIGRRGTAVAALVVARPFEPCAVRATHGHRVVRARRQRGSGDGGGRRGGGGGGGGGGWRGRLPPLARRRGGRGGGGRPR